MTPALKRMKMTLHNTIIDWYNGKPHQQEWHHYPVHHNPQWLTKKAIMTGLETDWFSSESTSFEVRPIYKEYQECWCSVVREIPDLGDSQADSG